MTIIPILHNIRSAHNVGAILRTCDGFGIQSVIVSGYTPYPMIANDPRLPHIAQKAHAAIAKTALGAESTVSIQQYDDIEAALTDLEERGIPLVALEQSQHSVPLLDAPTLERAALLLGEEVHGIPAHLIARCQMVLEIPMSGSKESFNVSVATGIALYQLCVLQ